MQVCDNKRAYWQTSFGHTVVFIPMISAKQRKFQRFCTFSVQKALSCFLGAKSWTRLLPSQGRMYTEKKEQYR